MLEVRLDVVDAVVVVILVVLVVRIVVLGLGSGLRSDSR
jgi:hypothetical protein